MKTIRSIARFAASLVLALPLGAMAEDIDIYDGLNGGSAPNVLFILDNAANFSSSAGNCQYTDGTAPTLNGTAGGIEQCALYNVLSSLPTGLKLNVGFMVYNSNNFTGFGCAAGGNGGCVIQPIVSMNDATSKNAMLAWIKRWQTSGNTADNIKASGEATAATVQEAWAYFTGKTGLSGRNYAGITPPNTGCQNNFVIFIGNAFTTAGTPGDGGSTSPSSALANAPGITSALKRNITVPSQCYGLFGGVGYKAFTPGTTSCGTVTAADNFCGTYSMGNHTDSSGLYADEWTRYMYQTDVNGVYGGSGQKIKTFTIGVMGPSCKADFPALLFSMASQGGGKYFPATSYQGIVDALGKIFNEVSAVNSVFSSSSLPVSVNTQGSYLNQIYMGMFRPDQGGNPRWLGNLKQYKFKWNASLNMLQLADSTGADAISSGDTGFISPNAISFWTSKNINDVPDSTGGFWIRNPQGAGVAFDSPDGEVVEKGGAAQQLRLANLLDNYASAAGSSSNPRRLYTYCPAGTGCATRLSDSTNAFATGNTAITNTMLGVAAADRDTLISWVRGQDNNNDELGPGGSVTVRPSIHGDVLHSRPVVLSYGGNPESVVVFYGGNDGVFHAVNGNQTASIGSVPPGGELWGLILPEFYGKLNRQRLNTPVLKLPSTNSALNPQPKDYFVDGSPGVFQQLNSDGTVNKSYLYLSMRRGGRFIYALDVSSPTDPKVLWKKSYTDAGMSELGQTWSRPKMAVVKGWNHPVLIFGAGYSPTQDDEPPTADNMGRGIFILDATNGDLIWSATPSNGATACTGTSTQASCQVSGMNFSIPSDVTPVDRDHDGYTDRLYVADTGGNVWRVDLEPTAGNTPDKWRVYKFAALGCGTGPCTSGVPRKFFYAPSVVAIGTSGSSTSYDAVMVGSGDREHPLYSTNANSAYAVTNRLYMLKDVKTGKDGSGLSTITEAALFNATSTQYDNTVSGFYITLGTGEKAVNAPLTMSGISYFGTNQPTLPSGVSCTANLGTARSYSMDMFTGAYRSVILEGGGLPPSPVSGIALVDGQKHSFCIGCIDQDSSKKSALENGSEEKDGKKKMSRTYWYKK
ncbi:pilus assembly protein [Noviherbaspirillum sp. UKPF54]|uniref:pilus assembly protein n=1 Tax=Noviherbaspirillum sp. UKPF54 TaxID=2601898 RepID=UPI00143D7178|nr:PilC/PilY family type IV pilus protein [Noviherbaspirillum sp. UKPF54]